ncbi:MAG: hypothetical protein KKA67_02870 [Spirochaetes bacterium]|nr:hypothetical protein [Spirochaetota bacterium]MBU1081796.1 hypothetical protein [Spirochaetota bacterium]
MKRFGLLLSAFFFVSCVTQPAPSPDDRAGAEAIAAPVRKERIEEYKTPVVIKETVAFADGVVEKVISYAFDGGFRRLESSVTRKPSAVDPIERVAYGYDSGRLASKTAFGPDGALTSKSEYAYGAAGELVKETILDGKGVVQTVSEWSWDNGRKTSWLVLSAEGLILARTDYYYEGEALASAKLLDGAGNVKGRIEYVYAGAAMPSQVKYFDSTGAQDGRIDYAIEDGRIVKESVYRADGRLERRLSYEYAPDGALVKRTLADSTGKAREVIVYENAYRTDTRTVVYYE